MFFSWNDQFHIASHLLNRIVLTFWKHLKRGLCQIKAKEFFVQKSYRFTHFLSDNSYRSMMPVNAKLVAWSRPKKKRWLKLNDSRTNESCSSRTTRPNTWVRVTMLRCELTKKPKCVLNRWSATWRARRTRWSRICLRSSSATSNRSCTRTCGSIKAQSKLVITLYLNRFFGQPFNRFTFIS